MAGGSLVQTSQGGIAPVAPQFLSADFLSSRHGLGSRLLETALAWAREQNGIDWVDLEVISSNLAARRLYERCGFVFTGEMADLFRIDGEGLGFVYMTQHLRQRGLP